MAFTSAPGRVFQTHVKASQPLLADDTARASSNLRKVDDMRGRAQKPALIEFAHASGDNHRREDLPYHPNPPVRVTHVLAREKPDGGPDNGHNPGGHEKQTTVIRE